MNEVAREAEVERVCVRIEWPAGIPPLCPECGRTGIWRDNREREWRRPKRLSCTAAGRFFTQWYRAVMRSKLEPVKKVARTLKAHLVHLLTSFQHPITNVLTEGFNSKIQAIKAAAHGFRRLENYRARILFFCGKLNLLLHLPSPPIHCIP
ncbi:MAG: transposase [Nitrospira sp.]|nr:transposase [Nitrospira sp.]